MFSRRDHFDRRLATDEQTVSHDRIRFSRDSDWNHPFLVGFRDCAVEKSQRSSRHQDSLPLDVGGSCWAVHVQAESFECHRSAGHLEHMMRLRVLFRAVSQPVGRHTNLVFKHGLITKTRLDGDVRTEFVVAGLEWAVSIDPDDVTRLGGLEDILKRIFTRNLGAIQDSESLFRLSLQQPRDITSQIRLSKKERGKTGVRQRCFGLVSGPRSVGLLRFDQCIGSLLEPVDIAIKLFFSQQHPDSLKRPDRIPSRPRPHALGEGSHSLQPFGIFGVGKQCFSLAAAAGG